MAATEPNSNHNINRLIELLAAQVRLYEQLHRLGAQQSQLVAEDSSEPLLSLLAQRQELIEQLDEVNRQLEPFRSDWQALWSGLDSAPRGRVGELVKRAQNLLGEIMDRDERDRQQLKDRQDLVGQELGRVSQSHAARQAYQGASSEHSHYTNQQA